MIKDMNGLDMRRMKSRDYLKFSQYGAKLKDDAPEELKESYRIYREQLERVRKREKELNAKIL